MHATVADPQPDARIFERPLLGLEVTARGLDHSRRDLDALGFPHRRMAQRRCERLRAAQTDHEDPLRVGMEQHRQVPEQTLGRALTECIELATDVQVAFSSIEQDRDGRCEVLAVVDDPGLALERPKNLLFVGRATLGVERRV